MKLTNLNVTAANTFGRGTVASAENRAQRITRMTAFWSDPSNAKLYPVGRLLAQKVDATKTVADVLVAGQTIEMDSITVDGKQLPLVAGFSLSLANMPSVWGCVACGSAHGSGIAPSREVSTALLQTVKFFYNPATRALVTISATCWTDYVKALGAVTAERFCSPNAVAPKPVVVAPVKVQPKALATA